MKIGQFLLQRLEGDMLAHFWSIVLNCDLLVPVNVLSFDQIFESAIHVDQQFLMLLVVLIYRGVSVQIFFTSPWVEKRTMTGTAGRVVAFVPWEIFAGRLDILRSVSDAS